MPSAALRLKRASLTRHSSIRACSKACRWDGISGLDKRDPACFAAKKRDTDDSLSVAAQLLCQEVQRVPSSRLQPSTFAASVRACPAVPCFIDVNSNLWQPPYGGLAHYK